MSAARPTEGCCLPPGAAVVQSVGSDQVKHGLKVGWDRGGAVRLSCGRRVSLPARYHLLRNTSQGEIPGHVSGVRTSPLASAFST